MTLNNSSSTASTLQLPFAKSISNQIPSSAQNDEVFSFSIALIGESGVGKTSIITRFTSNVFDPYTQSTTGIDIIAKRVMVLDAVCNLNLLDTAGQEKFGMAGVGNWLYRVSNAFIICYDVSNRDSFDAIPKWLKKLDETVSDSSTRFIVGTKSDLRLDDNKEDSGITRKITYDEGNQFAEENGYKFIEVSAKSGSNIKQLFMTAALYLMKEKADDNTAGGTITNGESDTGVITKATDEAASDVLTEISCMLDDEITTFDLIPDHNFNSLNDILLNKSNHGARVCPAAGDNHVDGSSTQQLNQKSGINSHVTSNHNQNHKNGGNGNGKDNNDDDDEKKYDSNSSQAASITRKIIPPTAVLEVIAIDRNTGCVTFSASKSRDKNGNLCVSFCFDFDDGTSPVCISAPTISRSYSKSGNYAAKVIVLDMYGAQGTDTVNVLINKPLKMESISSQQDLINTLLDQVATLENQKRVLSINNQRLIKWNKTAKFTNNVPNDATPNKKKKKKRKRKNKAPINEQPNYAPPSSTRATGNIQIEREITTKIIPSLVKTKHIDNLYSYMDKFTALQWGDTKYDIGDFKVMSYDFHHKENLEALYCVIRRQDETLETSHRYKWIMEKKLYNKLELMTVNIWGLPKLKSKLYTSSLLQEKKQIDVLLNEKLKGLMAKVPLHKLKIYNKQNRKKNDEIRWTLPIQKFREYSVNIKHYDSIPIIMSYHNIQNGVEYLVIMKAESGKGDIGISVRHQKGNDPLLITGFHIDKQALIEQHYLAMPYTHIETCQCFDSFNENPCITHLTVGDVNQHYIDKRTLEKEIERLNEEMKNKDALIDTLITPTPDTIQNTSSTSNLNSYIPNVTSVSTVSPSYSVPSNYSYSLSTPLSNDTMAHHNQSPQINLTQNGQQYVYK